MLTSHTGNTSTFTSLEALCPLDGRYQASLAGLRPILSEHGYMQRRVQVEITWFVGLCDAKPLGLAELPALSPQDRQQLYQLMADFSVEDSQAIKDFEKTTNHDVKAVEYWLKAQFQNRPGLQGLLPYAEFLHFACTSEDINNTSHALQLQAARRDVLLPWLEKLAEDLSHLAHTHAQLPMLSRTHGQTASPTTLGKEMANFLVRLRRGQKKLEAVDILAKMNGAVGNYNAHLAAYPGFDWPAFAKAVVENPVPSAATADGLDGSNHSKNLNFLNDLQKPWGLGLRFNAYTTQIEPHDTIAEFCDAVARTNTMLIDLARDIWGYVSLGYFKQKLKDGEVGSSTMPHKVNPIDFENAEGNLGLANALLRHMSEKLPISRFQRDLTDSTVLRNLGVALGYAVLAYQSLHKGFTKLQVSPPALAADLDAAVEVLAEPIQTVMRRYGVEGAYEKLKAATRGQTVCLEDLHALVRGLAIPEEAKARLLALTPASYTGLAGALAAGC